MRVLGMTVAVAALCALPSCGGGVDARDQWLVVISTDAPVPQLVDRALVEVLDESGALACDDCRRQLGLPVDASAWPVSFGIVRPASSRPLRLRVRLTRASNADAAGLPSGPATIDRVAPLPEARGVTAVALPLYAECIGLAADVAASRSCAGPTRALVDDARLGGAADVATLRPGQWSRAKTQPCPADPPAGMICVPGGLFVLGDARVRGSGGPLVDVTPERITTLAPFFIDAKELTVGAARQLFSSGRVQGRPRVRVPDESDDDALCTYVGPSDPSNDGLPLNCVSHTLAVELCAALGKRLPTEAEWEYAAGNTQAETFEPWGNVGDVCAMADVGLGRFPLAAKLAESSECRLLPGVPARPAGVPQTSNPRDVTRLGVQAMGGGLSEHVADRLAPYSGACWSPEQPFLDNPRCDDPTAVNFVIRGLSIFDNPRPGAAIERQGAGADFVLPSLGVRCAAAAGPTP